MNRDYSKRLFIMSFLLTLTLSVWGQISHGEFCRKSMRINNTGMVVLGTWAVANMATGAWGWSKYEDNRKYFHQMNLFWNTVNLSIAGIALYSNSNYDCLAAGAEAVLNKHLQTEKILLVNAALDIGYMGTGFLLKHLSGKSEKRADLLKGYGNSLILQGSFLLVFDLALYGIMRNARLDLPVEMSVINFNDLMMIGLSARF